MTGIVGSAIARSIRRDRGVRLLKVASIASIAVLVALAAVMVVDASLTILDPRVRWAMSLGILAVAILSGFLATLYMRRHRQSPRSMAKMLDSRHPEFQERLSTMVELSGRENAGFSRELFDVVCRRAADDAGAVVPEKEFPFGGAIRIGCVLLAMLLALLVSVVAAPSFAGRLLVRAIAPWADVGNVHSGDIEVKPGDVVALAGDVIRIEAKLKDSTVGRTRIRISRKTLLGWTEEAAEDMADGVYETTADINDREWRYRVTSGPAVTRFYHVRVSEPPRYREFSATVDYPEYTGWASTVVSNEEVRSISAINGSRVKFSLSVDDDIVSELNVGGKKGVFEYEMVSNRTSFWSLDLVNRDGFRTKTGKMPLASVLDQPPSVVVEKPRGKLPKLPPYAKIPVELTVSDDVCALHPDLLASVDGGETANLGPIDSFVRGGERLWRGKTEIDMSSMDLGEARRVRFMFVVRDACPAEFYGPHATTSSVIDVELGAREWGLRVADVKEQAKTVRELANEAKNRLRGARQIAEQAKRELEHNDKISENMDRTSERAAHELNEAVKRLEELRETLRNDERFRPMLRNIESNAVERAEAALRKMEAARFEGRSDREKSIQEAMPEMKKAAEELDRFERDLENRKGALEKMEKTRDLADRQKALAEEMRRILAERPHDQAKLLAWKQMQEETERRAMELFHQLNRDKDVDKAMHGMREAAKDAEQRRIEAQKAADQAAKAAQKAADEARKAAEAARQAEMAANPAADKQQRQSEKQQNQQQNQQQGQQNQQQGQQNQQQGQQNQQQGQQNQQQGQQNQQQGQPNQQQGQQNQQQGQPNQQQGQQNQQQGQQQSQGQQQQGQQEKQSETPADKAAQSLMESVEKQAEKLGIEKDDEDMENDNSERNSSASSSSGSKSSSGFGAEFKRRTAEMKRRDDPDFFKKLFSDAGWFKIRGSAKNGLSDRDLEEVPIEYRELTRRYFLKLSDE